MYYKNVIAIYKYLTQYITRYYSCIVSTSTIMTIIKILVFHNSHPQSPAKASITNRKRSRKKRRKITVTFPNFRFVVVSSLHDFVSALFFRFVYFCFTFLFLVSFVFFFFFVFSVKKKETTRKMKNRRTTEREKYENRRKQQKQKNLTEEKIGRKQT